MVGVPGRSRACLTCKKRRIACDLQRPNCGPCIKSRRSCSFPRSYLFVHNDAGSHKTIYRKSVNSLDRESRTNTCELRAAGVQDGIVTSDNSDEINSSQSVGHPGSLPRPISAFCVFQQQLLSNAISNAISNDVRPSSIATTHRPWTFALSAFAGSAHALNAAPLACYTIWHGRHKHDPYLVETSRRLYIQGLREVQEAVNDTNVCLRDETFAACLALTVYEALECPDDRPTGFSFHVEGCGKLVKLRGASMHEDGAGHELFCAYRHIGIIQALGSHRATYLSSSAWTTLPWRIHPKSSYDRLIDILAAGPALLQKGDHLGNASPQHLVSAFLGMLEDVQTIDLRLHNFYSDLSEFYGVALYWEVPSVAGAFDVNYDTHYISGNNSWTALQFPNLEVARILTLYWSMLSLVWSSLADISATLHRLSLNNLVGSEADRITRNLATKPKDWLDPARKVCQSVNFCTSNEALGIGALMIAVPLSIVIDVMKDRSGCELEYNKAVEARNEISRRWLRVLQFGASTEPTEIL